MKLLTLITLITPITLLANGGGYHIGTKFTGTPAPFQPTGTEHVQVLEEKLAITLRDEHADVKINYQLQNNRNQPSTVTFGFPVEVVHRPLSGYATRPDGKPLPPTHQQVDTYCQSYGIYADRHSLRVNYQPEPFGKSATPEFPGADVLENIQGWNVSTLEFKPGQTIDLRITYKSSYDDATHYLSNDTHAAPLIFRYRLSTGAVWAGPIRSGTVTVTAAEDVYPEKVSVVSPVNRFTRSGATWTWEFANLEPTLADDITIHTRPAFDSYQDGSSDGPYAQFIKTGDRWQRLHSDFEVTASSTLAPQGRYTFDAKNLKDPDWRSGDLTAWIEGADGPGDGEYLDIKVPKPLPLDAIKIRPGFGKSALHFDEHGRPWKIQLDLNGEHTVVHKLRGVNRTQTIHIPDYDKPIENLRLTIVTVIPGKRFDDTAIASIRLLARLPEKPKRYGAR